MGDRFDHDRLSRDGIRAADCAVPKVQLLVDCAQILRRQRPTLIHEADLPEWDRMRVFAEIRSGRTVLPAGVLDRAAVEFVGHHGILDP